MSGARYRAGDITVETTELEMVPPGGGHDKNQPTGDGAWLLVKRPGMVQWVRTPDELAALGVPMELLTLEKEW